MSAYRAAGDNQTNNGEGERSSRAVPGLQQDADAAEEAQGGIARMEKG